MPVAQYQACYFDVAAVDDDGTRIATSCKVWVYDASGRAMWELRRLFRPVFDGRGTGAYSTDAQIRVQKPAWRQWCDLLGWDFDDKFRPSMKSVAALGINVPRAVAHWEDEVREEPSMETGAVFCMLLMWAVARRRRAEQTLAFLLLAALVQTLLSAERIASMQWGAWFDSCRAACSAPTHRGECSHAAPFVFNGDGALHRQFAAYMQRLARCSFSCPCASRILRMALELLSSLALRTVLVISRRNPLKEQHFKVGTGRLARVDEDRRAVVASRGRGCSTAEAAACADPELGDASRTVRRWSARSIQLHVASSVAAHSTGLHGIHSLVEDAAGLGNPGEETVVYQHWSASSGFGHWLVPQARRKPTRRVSLGGGFEAELVRSPPSFVGGRNAHGDCRLGGESGPAPTRS